MRTRPSDRVRGISTLLLAVGVSLALAPTAAGQASRYADPPTATAPDSAAEPNLPPAAGNNPLIYGNTPPELRPFNKFVKEPYARFFVDKLDYLGPGRQKPEPTVEQVTIGLIAPIERTYEDYLGQDILRGTQLALEEANEAGGYQGKPFRLVVRNDTGLWGATANEVIHLAYNEHARLILGTVDSANTHIAIRVALKVEIPMINTGDLDPTLVETKIPWVYRVVGDDRQEAYTLAYYLYEQQKLSRVAVLRANNRYGRFGVAEFLASSVRLQRPAPLEINYEMAYERVNPDLTMQTEKLRRADPEAIVLWADARAAGHIVRTLRAAGLRMPIYACDRVIHPEFFKVAGEHAEGVVAVATYDPSNASPEGQRFEQAYRGRFQLEPTAYAAHGYDGARMGIEAIRKAGLNWAKIRDAIGELSPYDGVTGVIRFEHDLSNRRKMLLATARGGRFIYGEPRADKTF